ncbi:MAG: tetraacyldisaccharide 4'-kinase [Elusimicrobiota bacterium]
MRRLHARLRAHPLGVRILEAASIVYSAGAGISRYLWTHGFFRPVKLPAAVISVGNLMVGGTGKTTMTAYLAQRLLDQGKDVCVLSRGYKGGDEAVMLAARFAAYRGRFAVLTGPDRMRSARTRLAAIGPKPVFLLDDGHQHWPIRKDFSIVMFNALEPQDSYHELPYGFLREPLESGLRRSDAVVIMGADLADEASLRRLKGAVAAAAGRAPVFEATYASCGVWDIQGSRPLSTDSLKEQGVALLSAIGNPSAFERTVEVRLGAKVLKHFIFEDHELLERQRLEDIARWCRENSCATVLTTQKDAARMLAGWGEVLRGIVLAYMSVDVRFLSREREFWDLLMRRLASYET